MESRNRMQPKRFLTGNVFRDRPDTSGEEQVETLAAAVGFRVDRIVSRGHASPDDFWYDQEEDEWVLVVEGEARLQIDDPPSELKLGPGDWAFLPARCRHRVLWTDPDRLTIWLAVYGQKAVSRDGPGI